MPPRIPCPTSYGYHPGDCHPKRLHPPSRMWELPHPTGTFSPCSEDREGLLSKHLYPSIESIFSLAPAEEMDRKHALLNAQVSRA